MPLKEKIQQLEEQILQRIEHTFGEMRQEILDRFRTQSESVRQQLEGLSVGLSGGLLQESDLEPVLREVSEEARRAEASKVRPAKASAADLREALAVLDTARSQGDLLRVLLAQCGRFASRTALLLAQPGRFQGWGGHGFGDDETALRALTVEATEGGAWGRVLAGRGVVRLGSAERADMASRLEVPLAREAVLLPLMLRDRVAGAVYAERIDEEPLAVDGLQTLTYVAALAIETLPLRERESTPTLHTETGGTDETPVAAVEETPAAPPAPPAPPPIPEAAEEVEIAPAEMGEVEIESLGEEEGDLYLGEVELEAEEEISLEDFQAEPEPVAGFSAPGLTTGPETAALDEIAAGGEPVETAPPVADVGEEAEPSGWSLEREPAAAAALKPLAEPVLPPVPEALSPTAVPTTEPPLPKPAAAGEGAPGSSEVAPPSDVQGPGWAFAGTEEMDGDEETRHEDARRLARLLVSEIKLYNEEHVMAGRQSHDIFERLRDDIERSRQLYDARVDERVREKTDYFYQEMVRVLGGGDPKTLGI